jgi:hypothetical protein
LKTTIKHIKKFLEIHHEDIDICSAASYCSSTVLMFLLNSSSVNSSDVSQALTYAIKNNRIDNISAIINAFPSLNATSLPKDAFSKIIFQNKLKEIENLLNEKSFSLDIHNQKKTF